MKGQLASEHTRLIVPDEQLIRLGYPYKTFHILIPERRGERVKKVDHIDKPENTKTQKEETTMKLNMKLVHIALSCLLLSGSILTKKEFEMKNFAICLLVISLTIIIGTIGAFAVDESLGLYFSFEQVDGNTVKDLSGKGNDASIQGSPKITEGKYGKAMEFAGNIADKLIVPHNASLNPDNGAVTLVVWVYPTQFVGEWELVILKWQDANPEEFAYHLSLHNKKASLFLKTEAGAWVESIGKTTLLENEWQHIAAVADGEGTVKVYLNGVEDGIANYDGTIADTTVGVCIGGKIDGALFPFHGKMDEVAIFNRTLSADEIKNLMAGIISPVESQGKLAVTWASIKAKW